MNYEEIIIAVVFCVLVFFTCKLWGLHVVKQYEKNKIAKRLTELKPKHYSCDVKNLKLAGTGDDGNSDYEFSQAVAKIEVSENTRVQIYDKTGIH